MNDAPSAISGGDAFPITLMATTAVCRDQDGSTGSAWRDVGYWVAGSDLLSGLSIFRHYLAWPFLVQIQSARPLGGWRSRSATRQIIVEKIE